MALRTHKITHTSLYSVNWSSSYPRSVFTARYELNLYIQVRVMVVVKVLTYWKSVRLKMGKEAYVLGVMQENVICI
jgi:hypothetical protein